MASFKKTLKLPEGSRPLSFFLLLYLLVEPDLQSLYYLRLHQYQPFVNVRDLLCTLDRVCHYSSMPMMKGFEELSFFEFRLLSKPRKDHGSLSFCGIGLSPSPLASSCELQPPHESNGRLIRRG